MTLDAGVQGWDVGKSNELSTESEVANNGETFSRRVQNPFLISGLWPYAYTCTRNTLCFLD